MLSISSSRTNRVFIAVFKSVNNPMYLTLELTESNSDRVLQYIQSLDLWSRLYIHDPDYSVCLVECDCGSAAWLGLLG